MEQINLAGDDSCIPEYLSSLQFHAVVGILLEATDPMVSVMKLEKAPDETYADIGGLDQQIQEIKVCTRLCFMSTFDTVITSLCSKLRIAECLLRAGLIRALWIFTHLCSMYEPRPSQKFSDAMLQTRQCD